MAGFFSIKTVRLNARIAQSGITRIRALQLNMEPLEKAPATNTRNPAIPKNTPTTTRNESETTVTVVILAVPYRKMVKPRKHRIKPISTTLISISATN
jgi:hypothetical protein